MTRPTGTIAICKKKLSALKGMCIVKGYPTIREYIELKIDDDLRSFKKQMRMLK